jgi:hypothetical protein
MNDNRNNPQRGSEEQRPLEKNETLQNAGTVPDYGRSGENLDELERKHGTESGRQGNSSIPLDGDETIGNP